MTLDPDERAKLDEIAEEVVSLRSEFREFKDGAKKAHAQTYLNKEVLDQKMGKEKEIEARFDKWVRIWSLAFTAFGVVMSGVVGYLVVFL